MYAREKKPIQEFLIILVAEGLAEALRLRPDGLKPISTNIPNISANATCPQMNCPDGCGLAQ